MQKSKKTPFKKYQKLAINSAFALLGIGALLIGGLLVWIATIGLPDFKSFEERKISKSTKIYDKTGEILLYDIHQDFRRTVIPFADMGDNVKHATLAVEDAEFYNHAGVRPTAILRAFLTNILKGKLLSQGGSTITQQIVKNTLLTSEKTITRKLKELVLALKIETTLSKDEIFAIYLNESPYGGSLYGVEEASRAYFGKKPIDLTVAESAYLAAIPKAPSYYSPFGKNKTALDTRKNLVLSRMKDVGYINEEEYNRAKNEVVTFKLQDKIGIKAPHFVFFIKEYLENKYGAEVVANGGLSVTTTLDWGLQEKAEPLVLQYAKKNEKDYNGKNAALVAIDPKTGQILTMVGSRDYFDPNIDGNYNVTTASRQPGSSFKPFVYATAFNMGYRPETALFDIPTEFQGGCNAYGKALPGFNQDSCYNPENFDGKYKGPMSLRNALGESRNIPAVQLLYLVGVNNAIKTAKDMGITTLTDASRYGLSLVLGGGEVRLLDMASAYGVFATGGVRYPATGILKVTDNSGKILEEFTPKSEEVMPLQTALLMSDVLSDNVAKIPTFGRNSPLEISGRQIAVKTGTTNSRRDGWVVGYTPSLVVGVWAGNNENTPMKKTSAAVAGPLWNAFMKIALETAPNETFEKPAVITETASAPVIRGLWQGGESFFVDKISGKLATEYTPMEAREERVTTNVHSILYWIDKDNPLGPRPENPAKDPQFNRWETAVQNWWANNSGRYSSSYKPSEYDTTHTPDKKPVFDIVEPVLNKKYKSNTPVSVLIRDRSFYGIKKIDVFLNGNYAGSAEKGNLSLSFIPSDIGEIQENNELKIIATDSVFNQNEVVTQLMVE